MRIETVFANRSNIRTVGVEALVIDVPGQQQTEWHVTLRNTASLRITGEWCVERRTNCAGKVEVRSSDQGQAFEALSRIVFANIERGLVNLGCAASLAAILTEKARSAMHDAAIMAQAEAAIMAEFAEMKKSEVPA